MEVQITNENFETYRNGELPLVVDLWATWCGPCRMVAPIISELAQEYDGDYETASRGVTLTTLLSVITMPVVSLLLF